MMHAKLNRNVVGRGERGFTAIEIMVTLTIAGIMSAIAIPNFQQMYAKFQLYQATTSFYHRLIWAQTNAKRLNTTITAVQANLIDGAGQATFSPPVPIVETFPRSVGFILPPPPVPAIGFNGRGMSTTPLLPMTFSIQSNPYPNNIYTVSVYPSGRITMCRRNVVPCP